MIESIYAHLGEIILAIVVTVGAVFGYLAQKHAREANKAVNGNKNPDAVRLYDMVLNIDQRTDRVETWMHHHKNESNERDDLIDAVREDISILCTKLEEKIQEYGCPVRLGQRTKPLCQDDSVVD